MRRHRIPPSYALSTAVLSLAIYAMQLLGKRSTPAAVVAGLLTATEVLLDLRAAAPTQASRPRPHWAACLRHCGVLLS